MQHNTLIRATGELAYESAAELEERAKEMSFEGELHITEVEVLKCGVEEFTDPDGNPVRTDPMVLVSMQVEAYNGVDYSQKGNATGLEIDLDWKMKRGFPPAFTKRVEWETTVSRSGFCNHPKASVVEVGCSEDFCRNCEGPAI